MPNDCLNPYSVSKAAGEELCKMYTNLFGLETVVFSKDDLDGAVVGHRPGFFGCRPVRGYGLDLNNNGRYDRGQDGVLAFDFNRDGRLDKKELTKSREMLRAFGGNCDLNGDGNVDGADLGLLLGAWGACP